MKQSVWLLLLAIVGYAGANFLISFMSRCLLIETNRKLLNLAGEIK